jgi:hypothetical protein
MQPQRPGVDALRDKRVDSDCFLSCVSPCNFGMAEPDTDLAYSVLACARQKLTGILDRLMQRALGAVGEPEDRRSWRPDHLVVD